MAIAQKADKSDTDCDHAVFMNADTISELSPLAMPEGVISFIPGTIFDEFEGHGIIDFKVAIGLDVVRGVLTRQQARRLRKALDWAIKNARDEEPGNPISEATRRVYERVAAQDEPEAAAESKIDWSADAPEPEKENPLQQLFEYQAGGYPVGRAIIVSSGGERPEPCVIGFIADDELDVVRVEFGAEGGVELKTEDLTYVSLSDGLLHQLIEMSEQAEELFAKLAELPTDKYGREIGWEHLVTHPRQIEALPEEAVAAPLPESEAPSEVGREA